MPEYPRRESHFAHRAVRLMHKTCLAQEIGADAVSLLVVIAHQEDAKRYRGPVTFHNGQLLPVLGFGKWDRLAKARQAAVDAGWLHYENHGNKSPGIYWVTIPETEDIIDDAPMDEGLYPLSGYKEGYKAGYKKGLKEGMNRVRSGIRSGDDEGEHSTLSPIPSFPPPRNGRDTSEGSSETRDGGEGEWGQLSALLNGRCAKPSSIVRRCRRELGLAPRQACAIAGQFFTKNPSAQGGLVSDYFLKELTPQLCAAILKQPERPP